MVIGAFTSRNNKPHGKFATGLVKGDEVILEYYEPAHVTGAGEISITKVVHAYRDFFKGMSKRSLSKITGFGDSGSCNNNVHCPEAEDWQNEVRSVGMIVLDDGTRLCTGSLINNVKENYAPYLLTANHCLEGDLDTWVIWFNYESSTCDNPQQAPTAQTLVGTSLKANNSASDFALLILDETPPLDYNVYYNGWSNINTAPSSSVCIHHPSGDIKKISYEDDQATSSSWPGTPSDSHWRVVWDDGTTEGGSSGSPLYNPDNRVVGQLHGGTASCSDPDDPDYFGKFSMSWNYGGTSSTRLKEWLDPDNTGATVLDGMEDGMLSEGELPANATWSGTHTITGDLTVPSGITLTILPGTTIWSDEGIRITVNCTIIAEGTSNNRITFTGPETEDEEEAWGYLSVYGSDYKFEYCDFEYAEDGLLLYAPSQNDISNCNFTNNFERGILISGVTQGKVRVYNCNITDNDYMGIYVTNNTADDCIAIECCLIEDNPYGIYSWGNDISVWGCCIRYNNEGIYSRADDVFHLNLWGTDYGGNSINNNNSDGIYIYSFDGDDIDLEGTGG